MNAVDLFHATALMYAAQQEQGEQCVRLLLGENYTVGKVLADFVAYVTNDTITELYVTSSFVKCMLEGNGRNFITYVQLRKATSSVKFSNSAHS